jgi:four helix bundle protein
VPACSAASRPGPAAERPVLAALAALTPPPRAGAEGRAPLARKELDMLRIYPVILETLSSLRGVLKSIERHDADLARQMRRAASSVALNVSEGMYARGKNRTARYHTALGSMRETLACVEVAAAFGYVERVDENAKARANMIIGTLVKLVRANA